MNKTRTLLALLCAWMMLILLVPAPQAMAAGDVDITVTVNPTELLEAGTVSLRATIENKTNETISNVAVSFGGSVLRRYTSISPDTNATYQNAAFQVTDAMLGQQQTLLVTWQTGEGETLEDHSRNVNFRVGKIQPVVSVNATFNVDATSVGLGDSVTLSFTVENKSNVPITDVSIQYTDTNGVHYVPLKNDQQTIAAGGSIQVTEAVSVEEDTTFTPQLYYTAAGESLETALGSKTVYIASEPLIIRAETDASTEIKKGDTIPFTIYVENTNSYKIEGVKITDEMGNVVREGATIAGNSTAKITYRAQPEESRGIQFIAKYTLAGKEMVATSDPVRVTVQAEPDVTPPAEQGKITLSVVANPAQTTFPASVTFQITVNNEGTLPLYDVVVFEQALGEVGKITELAGGSRSITYTVEVKEPSSFVFGVSARDANGEAYAQELAPLEVKEPAAEVTPTPSPTPIVQPPADSDPFGTVMTIILILVVLVVLAAIALIILMIQEKRKQEAKREAERRARREAELEENDDVLGATAPLDVDDNDQTRVIPTITEENLEQEATREIPVSSIHMSLDWDAGGDDDFSEEDNPWKEQPEQEDQPVDNSEPSWEDQSADRKDDDDDSFTPRGFVPPGRFRH